MVPPEVLPPELNDQLYEGGLSQNSLVAVNWMVASGSTVSDLGSIITTQAPSMVVVVVGLTVVVVVVGVPTVTVAVCAAL